MSNPGCELRKLPVKQRKFLKAYLETGNAFTSSKLAGYDEFSGYEILKNPQFQSVFQMYLNKSGIDDFAIQTKLKELLEFKKIQNCNVVLKRDEDGNLKVQDTDDFIEVPDGHVQVKALELAVKLKGHLQPGRADAALINAINITIQGAPESRINITPTRGKRGNGISPPEPESLNVTNPGEDFSASQTVKP